jgi:transposase
LCRARRNANGRCRPILRVGFLCRVEARGTPLLHLPPYSPDFKPIELAFSKLKTWLRTAQARTRDALEAVMRTAMEWVTGADAKNWFNHCGYHVH